MNTIELSIVLGLIKNNDNYGFELLYKHYFRFIFSTAFSVVQNEDDSYDVVQNVMLTLAGLDKKKFPSKSEMSWLHTVIKNQALIFLRQKKPVLQLENLPELPSFDKGIADFVDMDKYYSMIESLSDKQKEVVTLKVLGGLTHKEIAQTIGKPIGTVQWLYNTSIKQLRVALAGMMSFVGVVGVVLSARVLQIAHMFYIHTNSGVAGSDEPKDPDSNTEAGTSPEIDTSLPTDGLVETKPEEERPPTDEPIESMTEEERPPIDEPIESMTEEERPPTEGISPDTGAVETEHSQVQTNPSYETEHTNDGVVGEILTDPFTLVFMALFLIGAVVTVVFLKKSDRLPKKRG